MGVCCVRTTGPPAIYIPRRVENEGYFEILEYMGVYFANKRTGHPYRQPVSFSENSGNSRPYTRL
jgi:hypothetical protein